MNKKISLGAAIAFMLIVAAATFSVTMIYSQGEFNKKISYLSQRTELNDKISELDRVVRQNYNGTINEARLIDSIARGYMEGIGDDYATYITAVEYQRLSQDIEGDNVGIGAVLEVGADGYLVFQEVYPNSETELAQIEVGDVVVRMDDTDLTLENSAQMLTQVSGAQGTTVSFTIRRGGEDIQKTVVRRPYSAPTVESRMISGGSVGYLLIKEFDDNTSNQFNQQLQTLLDQGATSLILDLRDNSGGQLRTATRIMNRLFPRGTLVSSAPMLDGENATVLYQSDANEIMLPMVALINENTSAEAEILAQNIRDFNKGRLVGTTTAGNGVVQEMIQLQDGSAIDLTVAYYFTRSGETFHSVGVKPDYEVVMDMDWTVMTQETDSQLVKAIEVAMSMEKIAANQEEQALQEEEEAAQEPIEESAVEPESTSSAEESLPTEDEESGEESDAEQSDSSSEEEGDSSEDNSGESDDGEESDGESAGSDLEEEE